MICPGKSILVTGALGSISEHVVRRLNAAGATLVLTDIKPDEQAKKTVDQWNIPPASYVYLPADITDSKQVDTVVEAAFEKYPALDTVIGHAGGCGLHPSPPRQKSTLSEFSVSIFLRRRIWREPF